MKAAESEVVGERVAQFSDRKLRCLEGKHRKRRTTDDKVLNDK